MNFEDRFSNLYFRYYYGGLIHCPEQWHGYNTVCNYSKLYYILDGECEFVVDGIKYTGKKGGIFLLPSGVRHSFYLTETKNLKKYWFHFEAIAGGENLFNIVKTPYYFEIGLDSKVKSLFKDIFKYALLDTASGQLLLRANMLKLFSVLIEKSGADEKIRESNEFSKVFEYINKNLEKNITLSELSEIAHLHPNYFIRSFKEKTGISPIKYINLRKAECAKSMLENTDKPIHEIMLATGFYDISHFSNFFKKFTGCSPTQFRERYK